MRITLSVVLLVALAKGSLAGELRWPDMEIPVPSQIQRFIAAECLDHQGTSEEGPEACMVAESHAYRAVVMMLMDRDDGGRAAERYRICRGGLGTLGGRFHRRKADCIGHPLGYVWRFEFSRRAALGTGVRIAGAFAELAGPAGSRAGGGDPATR